MKKKLQQAIVTIMFLVSSIISTTIQAAEFHVTGSGWALDSDEADSNGDGQGGSTAQVEMNGTYGNSTASARSDLQPWDGISFCDFDPVTGVPNGVLLVYAARSTITRFANGDLLFTVMDPAADSTLCFNFVNNQTATFEFFSVVTGGTGKFEGATGGFITTGKTTDVQTGHTGIVFEINGEIIR